MLGPEAGGERPTPDTADDTIVHVGAHRGTPLRNARNDVLDAYVRRLFSDEADPRYPQFAHRTRKWIALAQDELVNRIIAARTSRRRCGR